MLGLEPEAVLLSKELLKEIEFFDERIILPYSTMTDYLFEATCKDFELYTIQDALLYETGDKQNIYMERFGKDIDRSVLKEKWEMNYFNNRPNENLFTYVNKEKMQGFNVLEIGCDCGVNLLKIKNNYPNANLYGVEINPGAAKIASHIAEVKVGNIEDKTLKFGDTKFDYIMFGDVLEHLRDPEGTIRYCKEMLQSGGKIIACIPNIMHYSVMRILLDGFFTYRDTGLLDRTHIHFFTYNEIIHTFEAAGFTVEKMDSIVSSMSLSVEEKKFIDQLMAISNGAQEFMFYTFQYLVSAKINE